MKRQTEIVILFIGLLIIALVCICAAFYIYYNGKDVAAAMVFTSITLACITGICGVARQSSQAETDTTFTDLTGQYTQVETEAQRAARLRKAEKQRRLEEIEKEYSDVSEEQEPA
jgi:hypothetical protein